jgi:hypothetical protein
MYKIDSNTRGEAREAKKTQKIHRENNPEEVFPYEEKIIGA